MLFWLAIYAPASALSLAWAASAGPPAAPCCPARRDWWASIRLAAAAPSRPGAARLTAAFALFVLVVCLYWFTLVLPGRNAPALPPAHCATASTRIGAQ